MRVAVLVGFLVVVGLLIALFPVPGEGVQAIAQSKMSKGGDTVNVIIYKQPSAKALKEAAPSARIQGVEPEMEVLREYRSIEGVYARLPRAAVENLRKQGYLVEEDRMIPLALDSSNPVIFSDRAKRSGLKGDGIKVCVLDTGIDYWHTQLPIPPPERMSEFVNKIDGPWPTGANASTNSYTFYLNESLDTLNFSINWGITGNRFDFYVWYPNGTYAGGTNGTSEYLSTYWWLVLNLTDVPAGLYNVSVNNTMIIDDTNDLFTLYWDPYYPATGMFISDYGGHGTHVAGIISGNNTTYEGVAPNVTLYASIVCEGYQTIYHGCPISSINSGMQWCIDQGVDVMSMSIGGTDSSGSCSGSMDVMADTAADSLLPVIAAGNNGPSASSVTTPGCARKVIGVGWVNDAGAVQTQSGRGPTKDWRIKPDVVAPGSSITSTDIINTFGSRQGTSMATPHVSGVAALAKQANPTWTTPILKAGLMATAVKSNGGNHLDNDYGAGLVDVMRLVTEPYGNVSTLHRGDAFAVYGRWQSAENNYTVQSITNNTNFTMNITVPAGATSLKSVLYWEENSSDARSQMSLYLFDPAGNLADNSSLFNSTVQMVYNTSPMSGQWKLNVSGDNVQGTSFVLFTSIRLNNTSFAYAEVNVTGTASNFSATADEDRANYTNTTDNTWFVGVHGIKFYSNDSLGNWGLSDTFYLTMMGWAGINESAVPVSVDEDTNFTTACRVRDSNLTIVIQDYNISFWANDTFLGSGKTNSSGWANVTNSVSEPGLHILKCNITDDSVLYYDAAEPRNISMISVSDNTSPQYSGLQNTSAIYGADWQGNSTWTDNAAVSQVLFESNFTGTFDNYSASSSGPEYYFIIEAGNFSGGKVIWWRWFANDTSDNWNVTNYSAFTVSKAPALVRLFFNGTEGNRSYARGQIVNLTATVNVSGKYVILEANFSANYTVSENSTDTATNITNTSEMNITQYNVTAYFVADENYTAASATQFLNLLKANGDACSSSSECYSGVCCSGSCADSCGSGTPSGGGGGATAGTTKKLLYTEVNLTGWLSLYESHQTDMSQNDRAVYRFNGANHTITLSEINNTTVTLTIASTPYNITLSIGETKNIDLDTDGINDLGITLNAIIDSKADTTFTKLEAPSKLDEVGEGKVPLADNATKPEEGPETGPEEERPGWELLFAAFVLITAFLAIMGLRKRPKRRR